MRVGLKTNISGGGGGNVQVAVVITWNHKTSFSTESPCLIHPIRRVDQHQLAVSIAYDRLLQTLPNFINIQSKFLINDNDRRKLTEDMEP